MKDILISGASPVLMPREDPAGKIIFIIVLLIFFIVCFVALMAFMAAVLRGVNDRSKSAIRRGGWRTGLVGVAVYAVFGGFALWLYSLAFIERLLETEIVWGFLVAAIVGTVVPLLASLLGAPGTFGYVGDRIAALHGGEMSGLRRTVLGTVFSMLAAFFPLIGWFIVLPVLLVVSSGAGTMAIAGIGEPGPSGNP